MNNKHFQGLSKICQNLGKIVKLDILFCFCGQTQQWFGNHSVSGIEVRPPACQACVQSITCLSRPLKINAELNKGMRCWMCKANDLLASLSILWTILKKCTLLETVAVISLDVERKPDVNFYHGGWFIQDRFCGPECNLEVQGVRSQVDADQRKGRLCGESSYINYYVLRFNET